MSTTRQHPPGDLGPEPDGITSASASDASVSASAVPQTRTAPPLGADATAVGGDVSAVAGDLPAAGGSAPIAGGGAPGGDVPTVGETAAAEGAATEDAAFAAAEAAGRVRSLTLNGASGIVPLARDFTRQALYDWGWLPASTADRRAAAEDVLLVVSELVTNACLHAQGPDSLRVACDGKVLRLEVTDRSGGEPAPRTPHRAGRPGGHGMFIVQRLCLDWGVLRTPESGEGDEGKTVWAELAAPA
ncbi:ATP-binding protein [Streptomyces sp. NPDC004111]|uniref:ATP-binding protein n=1 Tax=Streptomyces sp. NPDC004111 TaxID=3364690 RepID=UPI003699B064